MSFFHFWFERRKCPCASAETSVRRERPVKEEEEKGSKEDGYKALAAMATPQHEKFQRASKNSCRLGVTETIITLW